MSIHIEAEEGQIAETLLLPGDPMRAKFIADNYLENVECHNRVRGMLGYTGSHKGKAVSVQSTGMGQPSAAIYVNELIRFYGAKTLIRIGSCASIQTRVQMRDLVVAVTASHDSNMNNLRFSGMHYSPLADLDLVFKLKKLTADKNLRIHFGGIFTSDAFYHDDNDFWKVWIDYGLLAIDMETAQLYTLAAKQGLRAMSLLSVSDHLPTGEAASSAEREASYSSMVEEALGLVATL